MKKTILAAAAAFGLSGQASCTHNLPGLQDSTKTVGDIAVCDASAQEPIKEATHSLIETSKDIDWNKAYSEFAGLGPKNIAELQKTYFQMIIAVSNRRNSQNLCYNSILDRVPMVKAIGDGEMLFNNRALANIDLLRGMIAEATTKNLGNIRLAQTVGNVAKKSNSDFKFSTKVQEGIPAHEYIFRD